MINEALQKAINQQIVREFYSANLYLAMSAHFERESLKGFANWMRVQYQEENFHALKFFDYLLDRGGSAELGAISAPPQKWDSPLHAFEDALHHEQLVTNWINEIADLALQHRDHALLSLLNWFVDEQVEEESTANEMVDRLKLVGDNKAALFMMDNEMKARVYTPPAAAK
ncbi:MAG: ferritin [Chloroflexota bacterium]